MAIKFFYEFMSSLMCFLYFLIQEEEILTVQLFNFLFHSDEKTYMFSLSL